MSEKLPWIFEQCSPEDARDPSGRPWSHAVRGQKPQRPAVIGYGHNESVADFSARQKAQQQDAKEVLGERGEVVTQLRLSTNWIGDRCMMTVYDMATDTALVQGHLVLSDIYPWPIKPRISGLGSVCLSSDFSMMPMGT